MDAVPHLPHGRIWQGRCEISDGFGLDSDWVLVCRRVSRVREDVPSALERATPARREFFQLCGVTRRGRSGKRGVFDGLRFINSMHALTTPRLVLLPGLDGTGALFKPLVDAIGSRAATTVISYSSPEVSRYADCRAVVERNLPREEPYVLVGESFSGPIAVSIAAARPPGLIGLVLAASFVSSPRAALKWFSASIAFLPAPRRGRWLAEILLLGRRSTRLLLGSRLKVRAHVFERFRESMFRRS